MSAVHGQQDACICHDDGMSGTGPVPAIQTVTGPISPDDLGRTLMHEHLTVGWPGAESHTTVARRSRADVVAVCVDRIAELQELGYSTLVDPCPNDLGRDVSLLVEVSEATGFNIICATGLYKESEGGHAYWSFKARYEDVTAVMAEMFESELTDGVGGSGARPGILKVATGLGGMTDHERRGFDAAAVAAQATGAPITTHTDEGTVGDLQQEVLTDAGVPARRILVGHSCGTTDADYHERIAAGGSYLGFDRFGIAALQPDTDRVASLVEVIRRGYGDRVVVSHDSVWCWQGEPFPARSMGRLGEIFDPTRFDREIVPMLLEAGVEGAEVEALVVDNPRRFFTGEPLPAG